MNKTLSAITAAGVAVAALPLLVLAGCGGSSASASATVSNAAATPIAPTKAGIVEVTLGGVKEFSITPSTTTVPAGTVTFQVHNVGKATHEMVVIRTDAKAAALPLSGGRAREAGNVGETGDMSANTMATTKLKLKAGHYALICNLPGHYVGGMRADFTVS